VTDAGAARGKELAMHHVGMDNLLHPDRPAMASVLDRLAPLLERGDLAPEVAETYSLADAPAAQRAVVEESVLGKVVVVL
jgi:NADPH:quinone reductase-like Zn-dependent oxidoreductase